MDDINDDGIYIDIDVQNNGGVLALLVAGVEKLEGWAIASNVIDNSAHRVYRFNLETRYFSWWGDNVPADVQVVIYAKQVVDILTFIREKGHLFIGIEAPAPRPEPVSKIPDIIFSIDGKVDFEQMHQFSKLHGKWSANTPYSYESSSSNEYIELKPSKLFYEKNSHMSWDSYANMYSQPYKMSDFVAGKMKEILDAYNVPEDPKL